MIFRDAAGCNPYIDPMSCWTRVGRVVLRVGSYRRFYRHQELNNLLLPAVRLNGISICFMLSRLHLTKVPQIRHAMDQSVILRSSIGNFKSVARELGQWLCLLDYRA